MSEYKQNDLENHHDELKHILETEIAGRYYYQKGRLEAGFKYDIEVKKAVEVLSNPALYTSVLKGEGTYKVIGKPGSAEQAKANAEREEEHD